MFIWVGLGLSAAQSASAALWGLMGEASWLLINTRTRTRTTTGRQQHPASNMATAWQSSLGLVHSSVWALLGAALVHLQYRRWLPSMEMAPHAHFNNYAAAVLDPLPSNAVLLINYVSYTRTRT